MVSRHSRPFQWHIDIDRVVNPLLPVSILPRLPAPVAHFLGHRSHPTAGGRIGNVAVVFWACIGVFSSLAVLGAVTQHVPSFRDRNVPVIVGSFVCPLPSLFPSPNLKVSGVG